MDELENRNTGDFSLEDILKEFADAPATEEKEDVVVWDGHMPQEPYTPPQDLTDTVRLDDVSKVLQEMTDEPKQVTEETVPYRSTVKNTLMREDPTAAMAARAETSSS